MEGYISEANGEVMVVLDTNLTEELIDEGFVRELISKIQTMRKEADFEVMDKIIVTANGSEKINSIFERFADMICHEVMADSFAGMNVNGFEKEWNINGEKVNIGICKVN